ncbi:hypothetical protein WEI85_39140 [Actinomycetes bacterium KLBMP 9797]
MRRTKVPTLLAAVAAAACLLVGTAHAGSAAPVAADPVTEPIADPAGAWTDGGPRTLAATNQVACDGDGSSGKRVQMIYMRETSDTDRLSQFRATFQQWAPQVDQIFVDSARDTGGYRRVRWVHDRSCVPTVTGLVVPDGTLNAFGTAFTALKNAGYNRTDRKYVMYAETTAWCGLGGGGPGAGDDRPGAENRYNSGPELATLGTNCWSWAATGHELLHTLGAVLRGAPNATANGHCWDDEDIMCYDDGGIPNPPGGLVKVCPDVYENYVDCGHDDYFHVSPPAGSWLASHWNVANSQYLIRSERVATAPTAQNFVPLATPTGVLDTRDGTGGTTGKRGAASMTAFQVTGVGGIPATGVGAVAVRVAVNAPTASTYLTVWPEGQPAPGISMLNVAAGENISNLAVVPVGSSGKLVVYNSGGSTDIVVDVQGYYTASGSGFVPVTHTRLVDTRSGVGTSVGTIPAGGSRTVTLTGSVIPAGATAAAVNLLVPGATAAGWLAAAPAGTAAGKGVLNHATGSTQSGATLKLPANGQVTFHNKGSAAIHLVVAAQGYYTTAAGAAKLTPAATRIFDTRTASTPLAAGATLDVTAAGANGVPAGAAAVAVNFAVTTPAQAGYLQAWPVGGASPTVSVMDFNAGASRANAVVLAPGSGGAIRVKNGSSGTIHLIVDVQGWYAP